jgi:hypothetical protein
MAMAFGVMLGSLLPACTSTAGVADVYMALEDDGVRVRKVFFTDSANVSCIAEVASGRENATFEMLIRRVAEAPFATDNFEPTNRVILVNEFLPGRTTGTVKIALSMKPTVIDSEGKPKEDTDAPFSPGSYVCEVYLDGKKAEQAAFNIDYAPCPPAEIQPDTPCAGFYTIGTECPAGGATGEPDPTCACSDKGWQCG